MSPRADALRNRALVLATAEAVFAARGVTASTEEIARAAGVGIGTVFRHFPTKEALLAAVYEARLERAAEDVRVASESADPGVAFVEFFRHTVAESGTKLAVVDALAEAGIDVRPTSGSVFPDALRTLLERAQRAGAVRPDIGVPDLIVLLAGASRAVQLATSDAVRDRLISIVLDGLSPRSGTISA